jgi:heme exporter protein D
VSTATTNLTTANISMPTAHIIIYIISLVKEKRNLMPDKNSRIRENKINNGQQQQTVQQQQT